MNDRIRPLLNRIASRLGWLIAWQWVWLVLILVGLTGCATQQETIPEYRNCSFHVDLETRMQCVAEQLDRLEKLQRRQSKRSQARRNCQFAHGPNASICDIY